MQAVYCNTNLAVHTEQEEVGLQDTLEGGSLHTLQEGGSRETLHEEGTLNHKQEVELCLVESLCSVLDWSGPSTVCCTLTVQGNPAV